MDKLVMHPLSLMDKKHMELITAIRNINGITVLNAIPTKGSGYLVGDLLI
jgi:hypothetical protein